MTRILFVTALLLASVPALAQQDNGTIDTGETNAAGQHVLVRKNTTIDYDTKVIRGEVDHPMISLIQPRVAAKFGAMIPERAHFKAELARSLDGTPR